MISIGSYQGYANQPQVSKLVKYKTQCGVLTQVNNEFTYEFNVWETYDQCELSQINFKIKNLNWQYVLDTVGQNDAYRTAATNLNNAWNAILNYLAKIQYNVTPQVLKQIQQGQSFQQNVVSYPNLVGVSAAQAVILNQLIDAWRTADILLATYVTQKCQLVDPPLMQFRLFINGDFYGFYSSVGHIDCCLKLTAEQYNLQKKMVVKLVLDSVQSRFQLDELHGDQAVISFVRNNFQWYASNQYFLTDFNQSWLDRKAGSAGSEDGWCSVDIDASVLFTLFNN